MSLESLNPSSAPASFGHHFLIGLQKSPTLTDHDKRLLAAVRPAGVVLFRDNFRHDLPYEEWLEIHRRQLAAVREVVERDRLLICIDHEGGAVHRTPAPITAFAPAAEWAGRAAQVGTAMGRELRSLGINLNFAPVVDVHSNAANPVIGSRALGRKPDEVIAAAEHFIQAQQAEGVLACIKHFPGHGGSHSDSHHELPVVDLPLADLEAVELAPFRALVGSDVRLVMTGHILFPQWDPDWPATLSHTILDGMLRGRLGYRGAVVTDDVGMAAIADRFSQPGTAARAVVAGCDLIAICAHLADTGRALDLARDLAGAWQSGRLPVEVLERSHRRIDGLIAASAEHAVRPLTPEEIARGAAAGPVRA